MRGSGRLSECGVVMATEKLSQEMSRIACLARTLCVVVISLSLSHPVLAHSNSSLRMVCTDVPL